MDQHQIEEIFSPILMKSVPRRFIPKVNNFSIFIYAYKTIDSKSADMPTIADYGDFCRQCVEGYDSQAGGHLLRFRACTNHPVTVL